MEARALIRAILNDGNRQTWAFRHPKVLSAVGSWALVQGQMVVCAEFTLCLEKVQLISGERPVSTKDSGEGRRPDVPSQCCDRIKSGPWAWALT